MYRIWWWKTSVISDLLWLADWLVQVNDLRISLRMGRTTTMLFVLLVNINFFKAPPIRKINSTSYDHVRAVIWGCSGREMQRNLKIFVLVFLPIPYKRCLGCNFITLPSLTLSFPFRKLTWILLRLILSESFSSRYVEICPYQITVLSFSLCVSPLFNVSKYFSNEFVLSPFFNVFGPKRDEVTGNGENYIMKSLVICTPYRILCGW